MFVWVLDLDVTPLSAWVWALNMWVVLDFLSEERNKTRAIARVTFDRTHSGRSRLTCDEPGGSKTRLPDSNDVPASYAASKFFHPGSC